MYELIEGRKASPPVKPSSPPEASMLEMALGVVKGIIPLIVQIDHVSEMSSKAFYVPVDSVSSPDTLFHPVREMTVIATVIHMVGIVICEPTIAKPLGFPKVEASSIVKRTLLTHSRGFPCLAGAHGKSSSGSRRRLGSSCRNIRSTGSGLCTKGHRCRTAARAAIARSAAILKRQFRRAKHLHSVSGFVRLYAAPSGETLWRGNPYLHPEMRWSPLPKCVAIGDTRTRSHLPEVLMPLVGQGERGIRDGPARLPITKRDGRANESLSRIRPQETRTSPVRSLCTSNVQPKVALALCQMDRGQGTLFEKQPVAFTLVEQKVLMTRELPPSCNFTSDILWPQISSLHERDIPVPLKKTFSI
ncbi:hypothetical protein KC356_g259 [Hortaea werneckii]|nr:hypothetical protein KC356_g259 [Hortaea werneckii]